MSETLDIPIDPTAVAHADPPPSSSSSFFSLVKKQRKKRKSKKKKKDKSRCLPPTPTQTPTTDTTTRDCENMADFDADDDDAIVRRMGSMSVHNQNEYNFSNQCQPSFFNHSNNSSLIDEDPWIDSFSTTSHVTDYDVGSSSPSITYSSNPYPDLNQQQQYSSGSTTPASLNLFPNEDVSFITEKSLSEFKGSGGGQGIFKLPLRAPVHPGRPPSFDLRPHPLRELQAGSFFRTLISTPTQLWAGLESGVRSWNLSEVFAQSQGGIGKDSKAPLHEKNTAPYKESIVTSPTLCFAVDTANNLVWSGHKDGRIRFWNVDHSSSFSDDDCNATSPNFFKENLCWTAHRAHPVLSMAFTSYGDLWSGSEGGIIRIWPWEIMEKSLSEEKKHMGHSLRVERSYVDLKNRYTFGGVCSLPSSDVKFMLSDHSRSKVWSGGSLSFVLWNSRTRELLKFFNIDGQVDFSYGYESYTEDDMKGKFVPVPAKKEKSQTSTSFFQRSRNALIGAAGAVRRVATKGTFGDDNHKSEAITISMDGMIWTGSANGVLVQWDGDGNRMRELPLSPYSIRCLCSFGSRIWVGSVDGSIRVLDLEGNTLGGWFAHSCPVINIAVGGGYIFTLANHGGIRGWSLTSPGPLDCTLKLELTNKEILYTHLKKIKILAGTWNVGQERASNESLISWIGDSASKANIIVVGLQEVEMGAGFLAMAVAKETVGLEGSANGQWWLDTIGKTLDQGTTFYLVGSRQLAGLLISIWAKENIRNHIGDVDVGAVPCGFGNAIGNKGSVGLKMRLYDKIFCFVNCHFAAHMDAVDRRNADFDHVYRTMCFSRPSSAQYSYGAGSSSAVQLLRSPNVTGLQSDEGKPELSEADMVIFLGDLNYRLKGISYDESLDFISKNCFDWLRQKDQLRAEMKAGKAFQGMREGIIRFPPTYKFEKHQYSGYDTSEKKRIPAWCDRIVYRDNRCRSGEECSLSCPVTASILEYDACMKVIDSDHKPVRCLLNVNIACLDELIKRQEFGMLMASKKISGLVENISIVPETGVSTNKLSLQNDEKKTVSIVNRCVKGDVWFEIICEGSGFPRWLEVNPAFGIIKSSMTAFVSLCHMESQIKEDFAGNNRHGENKWEKEVMLMININGGLYWEKRRHQIRVSHSFSKVGEDIYTLNNVPDFIHF